MENLPFIPDWLQHAAKTNPWLLVILTATFATIAAFFKSIPAKIWELMVTYLFFTIKFDHKSEFYWLFDKHLASIGVNSHFNSITVDSAGASHLLWSFSNVCRQLLQPKDDGNRFNVISGYGGSFFQYKGTWYRYKKERISEGQSFIEQTTLIAFTTTRKTAITLIDEVNALIPKTAKSEVYMSVGKNWQRAGDSISRDMSTIVQPAGIIEGLIQDVTKFVNGKDYYVKTGTPYRRAYIFHGMWGTGKTSAAMALAKHLDRPLYLMNLGSYMSQEQILAALWETTEGAVILIEDVDCAGAMVQSRTNLAKTPKSSGDNETPSLPEQSQIFDMSASLSEILNSFDGVLTPQNRIFIFTTNCIDDLDPAFIRPGRIDEKIEFKHLMPPEQKRMVEIFFGTTDGFTGVNRLAAPCVLANICRKATSSQDAQHLLENS